MKNLRASDLPNISSNIDKLTGSNLPKRQQSRGQRLKDHTQVIEYECNVLPQFYFKKFEESQF